MTDETFKESILLRMGATQEAMKAHEKRLDKHEEEIAAIRKDLTDIKVGQVEQKSFMMQCFAEQSSMLLARIDAIAVKERGLSIREFIQNRPITATIGSGGIASSVLIYILNVLGVLHSN